MSESTPPDLGFTHRYLAPRGESKTTFLLLHGTGGNEDSLLDLGRALNPQASLLSPRGKVLEGGAPRFFRRLAEGVFDLPDLHRRTDELADFVEDAADQYGIDLGQLVAIGYSNGANIATSLLLQRPKVLTGAVLLRPMVPFVPERDPQLSGKKVLISAGERDSMTPTDQPQALADLLTRCGADVELVWQPGGHGLTDTDIQLIYRWLADHNFRDTGTT